MRQQWTEESLQEFEQSLDQALRGLSTVEPLLADPSLREKLCRYGRLLVQRNAQVNLTAITEPQAVALLHFLDSLSLQPYLKSLLPEGAAWIDVGTGAGLPSLPNQLVEERGPLTLFDSKQKRLAFLQEVITLCQLKQVSCLHGRAEYVAHERPLREHFQLATARAVAPLPTLLELCLPFVRVGGYFLCMKGSKDEQAEAEQALRQLGGKWAEKKVFQLPTGEKRQILVIEKIRSCAPKFPRKPPLPTEKPL